MNWQLGIKRGLKHFLVRVTLAAWVLYLLTLTRGVSLANLGLASQLCGWDYQPLSNHPLWWLLTLPLRVLPPAVIPLAANFLAATCAALALGMLAATLERLAWPRPPAGLPGWSVRVPVVLGVVVCGGEFNFWQAATAATGEALPLLLLSAALWCLFTYRAGRQFPWLQRACLLWGLGMAENWMMILTFPLFAVAVFWLSFPRLIKWRPALQVVLPLAAGAALIFLPPVVNSCWPHSPWTAHEAWRDAWHVFKHESIDICFGLWRGALPMVFIVLVFYLLAGLPALLRVSDAGTLKLMRLERVQVWLFRALRAGLLLVCLWLAFDPTIGLRQLLHHQVGLALPLLSLDYLLGIGTGVLAAHLLLGLHRDEVDFKNRPLRVRHWFQSWPVLSPSVLAGVLVIILGGLLWRNLPAITLANRQPLAQFGESALAQLPAGGGIVLSDDPFRLNSFMAAAASAPGGPWLGVNTGLLPAPAYRHWLAGRPGGAGLANTTESVLSPPQMVVLLEQLIRTNRIFYLYPSFGYFFDFFYLDPVGPIYELKPLPPGTRPPPPLAAGTITTNETFWEAAAPKLTDLNSGTSPLPPPKAGWLQGGAQLFLKGVEPLQSQVLASCYAVALSDWAVRLQRAGQLTAARHRLDQAIALYPYNPAAQINWLVNSNLLAGNPMDLSLLPGLSEKFSDPNLFGRFMENYGPVDEPAWCLLAGKYSRRAGLLRSAQQQFGRVNQLVPHNESALWELAQTYAQLGLTAQARTTLDQLRQILPPALFHTNYADARLSLLEAKTWYAETNAAQARQVLRTLKAAYPTNSAIAMNILEVWLKYRDWNSALQQMAVDATRTPNSPSLLNLQGAVLVQAGQPAAALKVLDHLLALTNLPAGRVNHAATQLVLGNHTAADREWQEIAQAGGETNAVARWQAFLPQTTNDHAPPAAWGTTLADSPSGPVLVPRSGPPNHPPRGAPPNGE